MERKGSMAAVRDNYLEQFLKFNAYYISNLNTSDNTKQNKHSNGNSKINSTAPYNRLILFTKCPLALTTTDNQNLMNPRVYKNLITTKTYKFTPSKNTQFSSFLSSIATLNEFQALKEISFVLIHFSTKFFIDELYRNVLNGKNKFYILPLIFRNGKYLPPTELLQQINSEKKAVFSSLAYTSIYTQTPNNTNSTNNLDRFKSNNNKQKYKQPNKYAQSDFVRLFTVPNKVENLTPELKIPSSELPFKLFIKINDNNPITNTNEITQFIKTKLLEDILISVKILLESTFINNFIGLLDSLSSLHLISNEMQKTLNILRMSILAESQNNRFLQNIVLDINYFQSDLFTIFCGSFDRKLEKNDLIFLARKRNQLYDILWTLLDIQCETEAEDINMGYHYNGTYNHSYTKCNVDSVGKLSLVGIYFNKFISVTQHFLSNPSSKEHKLSLEGLIGMNHSISCEIFHNYFKNFVNRKHLPIYKLDDRFNLLTSKDEARLGKQKNDVHTNFVLMNETIPEKDKKDHAIMLSYYTTLSRAIVGFIIRFGYIVNKDSFTNIQIFSEFYVVCLLKKWHLKGFTHLVKKPGNENFLPILDDLSEFINSYTQQYRKEDFYKAYGSFIMNLNESTFQVLENIGDSILNFYIVFHVMKSAVCLNEREMNTNIFGANNALRTTRDKSWQNTVTVIYKLISNKTLNLATNTTLASYFVKSVEHVYRQYCDSFECFIGGLFGINAIHVLFNPIKKTDDLHLREDINYFDIIEGFIKENIFTETILNKYRIFKDYNKIELKNLFRMNRLLIAKKILENTKKRIPKDNLELAFDITSTFDNYECIVRINKMKIVDAKHADRELCIENASKLAYQYLVHYIKGKKEVTEKEENDEKEEELEIDEQNN